MCCVWEAFTAIGTVGATVLALVPVVKENWRKLWIKIHDANIMPITHNFDGSKSDEIRKLCLHITNRQNFDIGIQMAYVKIYKKDKHTHPLFICFGTRERHPTSMIAKNETNTYFLKYNNDCLMESEQELRDKGIPDAANIKKITIELYTTVRVYYFKVRKKDFENITAGLSNFSFPPYKVTPCTINDN